MITLLRSRRPIYVCNVFLQNNVKRYKEPIKLYESYQVTNNEDDMKTFGLEAYQYIRIKTNIDHKDYYHLGDMVYVNTTPPSETDELCKTADYEVYVEPTVSFNYVEVLLRRRSGRR